MTQTSRQMGRKKQKWGIGDVFIVSISDGKSVVAQIIGREAEVLNSVTIAFFDVRVSNPEEISSIDLIPESVFSTVFATRDLLDSGDWRVVENRRVIIPVRMFPHEDNRASGFAGAKVIGSGILNEFLNAFYSLTPWDDWKDPDYLDNLLLDPSKKPSNLLFKSQ